MQSLIFARRKAVLNNAVTSTCWRTRVAIGSGNGTLLQQTHELTHRVGDGNLSLALNKNVQLGILVGTRLFASGIETALGGDGSGRGFQDFGDVRAVGDGPTSFLCKWEIMLVRIHEQSAVYGRK